MLDSFVYLLDTTKLVTANIVNPYLPTTDLAVMSGGPSGPLVGGSRVFYRMVATYVGGEGKRGVSVRS